MTRKKNSNQALAPLLVTVTRLVLASLGGGLVYTSYQPLGWWPAAIFGMALLLLALSPWQGKPVTKKFGALLGFIHGFTCFYLLLPWVGEFVGRMPFIALATTEAAYGLLLGAGGAVLLRYRKLGLTGMVFWYSAIEFLRSSWPFGGFAWTRLAWGQVGGPLSFFVTFGGPALVSFAVVFCAAAIVWSLAGIRPFSALKFFVPLGLGVGLPLAVGTGLMISLAPSLDPNLAPNQVTVAAVQGNVPRMGMDFNAQRRAVLNNHVTQTEAIGTPVDFAVWPENSADVNPFTDQVARKAIGRAVAHLNAPILVGTLTADEAGDRNTLVVFNADGSTGERHNKVFLQPFGEYMPYRSFFRKFTPLVDQAGNFVPGTDNGVVHVTAAQQQRTVALGALTCYEVAFDAAARNAVLGGATILSTPTNNATFGFTNMSYQQLAMSQLRALETHRAVVVAATSGVSAIIMPNGQIVQETRIFTPATLVATVPEYSDITLAIRIGLWLERSLVLIGVFAALIAVFGAASAKRTVKTQQKVRKRGNG